MNRITMARVICLAVALAIPCLAARAAPLGSVKIAFDGHGAYDVIDIWGGGHSSAGIYSGVYTLEKDGGMGEGTIWPDGQLDAFCIELHQYVSTSQYKYDVVMTENVYNSYLDETVGADKASYISELWGRFFKPSWQGDGPFTSQQNSDAAAFAAAIWEIIYEDFPTSSSDAWDVTIDGTAGLGGFKATGVDSTTANAWLAALDGTGPMADLRAFVNCCKQDYIIEVPEPATIAMLGLGGVLSLVRRKRAAA
jgi:hypothetical protein